MRILPMVKRSTQRSTNSMTNAASAGAARGVPTRVVGHLVRMAVSKVLAGSKTLSQLIHYGRAALQGPIIWPKNTANHPRADARSLYCIADERSWHPPRRTGGDIGDRSATGARDCVSAPAAHYTIRPSHRLNRCDYPRVIWCDGWHGREVVGFAQPASSEWRAARKPLCDISPKAFPRSI